MIGLSVKPRSEADLLPHLALFSVGEESKWVGYGENMLYRPIPASVLDPESDESVIVARAAFALERTVIGEHAIVPASRLGQVAVLATLDARGGTYKSAFVIPNKPSRLTMATETIVLQTMNSNAEVDQAIYEPLAALHAPVRHAIFQLINSDKLK